MNAYPSKISYFTLPVAGAALSFAEVGAGENIILCTHGYKNTKAQFLALGDYLPTGWRILAFDQPMHGDTLWEEGQTYDTNFFRQLWEAIAVRYPHAQWHLMGFSMGGKAAMFLHLTAPHPIHRIFLIAPAGIHTSAGNRFFSYHFVGRRIFHFLLTVPKPMLWGIEKAYRLKWIPHFSYRFVKAHFSNPDMRAFMLRFIPIYRTFHLDFDTYSPLNLAKNTPTYLFWGKNDEVIPLSQSRIFLSKLPHTQFSVLEGKHNLLEENIQEMGSLLGSILEK
jgi:pimeloyl-ACP methyl ester carboxylesterase